jgi:hypothetical protein
MALVGERGIGEAVAQDDLPRRQRRSDHALDVVAARGERQQRLGHPVHRLAQQQLAQPLSERRAARLAGAERSAPCARSRAASGSTWVDLPAPSMPSKVMNRLVMARTPAWIAIDRAIVLGERLAELAAAVAAGDEVERLGRLRPDRGEQCRLAGQRDRLSAAGRSRV